MKCRICGAECPPGARHCRDCARARKRAFAATVTQPLFAAAGAGSLGRSRFAARPRSRARFRPEPAPVQSPGIGVVRPAEPGAAPSTPDAHERALRRPVAPWLVAAVVAAAIATLVAIRLLRAGQGSVGEPRDTAETPSVQRPPASPPAELPPAAVPARATPAMAAATQAAGSGAPEVAPRPASGRAPARRSAPAPAEMVRNAPAAGPPQIVAEQPRAVVPPLPVAEATRRDPVQTLSEALTRCAREDLVRRMACEQRARLQYCGDSWGQIPQCPIGPATDHGQ